MRKRQNRSSTLARNRNSRDKKSKRFVFEFTTLQFFLLICLLFFGLFWMFGLGLTIGRGLPSETRTSLWGKFAHMFGYEAPETTITKHASTTWENPETVKLSLTYYDALTKPPKTASPKTEQQLKEKEEAPVPSEKDLAKSEDSEFTVLVASFKSRKNAQQLEKILKSKGYPVYRQVANVKGSTWYRVMVGNFKNRSDALRFVALFNKKEKLEAIVIHK